MSDAWKSYLLTVAVRAVCCAIVGFLVAVLMWLRTNRHDADVNFLIWTIGVTIAGGILGAVTVPREELPWVDLSPNTRHCPKCGYDLRGDRAAGCPECGWNRDKPPPRPIERPTGPYDVEE